MEEEFWLKAWQKNQTGFHQSQVNPYLLKYWPKLGVARGTQVFVPLCGKSLDMIWLEQNGFPVVGVEISPLAVSQFFLENNLSFVQEKRTPFELFVAGGLSIFQGNFFSLTPDLLTGVGAAYDRAALIAMPPDKRPAYVDKFASLMPAGAKTFLVSFDYPQEFMEGPPFSVPAIEVDALYKQDFRVTRLSGRDILDRVPQLAARGITRFVQEMFLVERR